MAEKIHTTSNKELLNSLEVIADHTASQESIMIPVPEQIFPSLQHCASFFDLTLENFILRCFFEYFEIFLSEPDTFSDFFMNQKFMKEISYFYQISDELALNENDTDKQKAIIFIDCTLPQCITKFLFKFTQKVNMSPGDFILYGFREILHDLLHNTFRFHELFKSQYQEISTMLEVIYEIPKKIV